RRGEYGTATFAVSSARADRLGQLWALGLDMIRDLHVLLLVAIVGFVLRRRQSPPREDRSSAFLLASFVLSGPLFVLLFNLSTRGLDRLVVERFYLLPLVVLSVTIAPYLDPALAKIFARAPLAIASIVTVAAISALLSVVEVEEIERPSVELY